VKKILSLAKNAEFNNQLEAVCSQQRLELVEQLNTLKQGHKAKKAYGQ